jgi:hypothetical protein
LIEKNVQEGRRTAEQGRTAIACLNRNEIADIEPQRSQELNVVGLEAFEADIELLCRRSDGTASSVGDSESRAQSRGNFNQAHLREHIESLLAQQDDNVTVSSRIGPLSLGLLSLPWAGILTTISCPPGAAGTLGGMRKTDFESKLVDMD